MKNYTITVNGNVYDVVVEEGATAGAPAAKAASRPAPAPKPASAPAAKAGGTEGSVKIEAGAAGKIFKVEVSVGQSVKAGDTIVILEAMKMEIPIAAPQDGTIASVNVTVGNPVEAGALIATIN